MTSDQLTVRSHVARDLLQSAGLFKTDKLVVWEYVSNGLQYVDRGTTPKVKVKLDGKNKRITIEDNGRGMDWEDLHNFFVMHGENVDRKGGAPGRGRFGTGKSAAFGVADTLRITTVRRGKRSQVELTREDIDAMGSEDPIPVRVLQREVPTRQPNGTLVDVEGIHLRSLDQSAVIRYMEKHLVRWRKDARVFINNHECEPHEPPIAEAKTFAPDGELKEQLGEVALVVKIAQAPLEEDLRGIAVFSKGVWYETTLAGNEGREMSQYIMGEIDIPALDSDTSVPAAFDMSRSMKLNPENPLVHAIHIFVGQKVDEVRRELVDRDNERRKTEEAKKLKEQASEIARALNEDFESFRRRLAKVKAETAGGVDFQPGMPGGDEGDDFLVPGGDEPAAEVYPPKTDVPLDEPPRHPELEPDAEGEPMGNKVKAADDGQRRPRGGFSVEFRNMGAEEARAVYSSENRTIYINLDHPQLEAARGLGTTEDPSFRRLAYEVAFSEYSIALAYEMALRGEFIEFDEPVGQIRDTVNRLARKSAGMYAV